MNAEMSTTKENDLWEDENSTEPKKNCLTNIVKDQNDIINVTKNDLTLKAWKDTGKISGIYKIINKVNGKYYVGSSLHIKSRWRCHKSTLRRNIHRNDYLQRAWNKDGKENFNFVLVEHLDKKITLKELLIIEQKYLDIAETETDKCYNLFFKATGTEWSTYSKEKLSKKHSGIGNPMFGKTHRKEIIELIRKSSSERKHNESTKEKMRCIAIKRGGITKFNRDRINDGIRNSHPNYFLKIHSFINKKTQETFTGTLEKFVLKTNSTHVHDLIKGKRKSEKGWMLNPPP